MVKNSKKKKRTEKFFQFFDRQHTLTHQNIKIMSKFLQSVNRDGLL